MITGMPRIAIAATDFDALVDTFRNRLGMPVVDLSDQTVRGLGARIAMCVPEGGSNIELMSPAVPDAPLSRSLQRFLDRRGAGPFALMLEAPDPDAEAEVLHSRGLNVLPRMAGAGGRDVHPNSTHGVLIRVYPVGSFRRPPSMVEARSLLSGIVRVIIAVKDLSAAATTYGTRFGLPSEPVVEDPARGVASVTVRPPTGGTIELVTVRDPGRPFAAAVGAHLDANPEGIYALVLQARDPAGLIAGLRTSGLDARLAADAVEVVEIGRGSMFGALLRIERG
ncbi:MAG: hypothetical protein RIS35_2452 [Pseudomonadota bacterium]|jgi:catechol 2,3-dioxygenase-like lactoylglutathione lyase family enzyme